MYLSTLGRSVAKAPEYSKCSFLPGCVAGPTETNARNTFAAEDAAPKRASVRARTHVEKCPKIARGDITLGLPQVVTSSTKMAKRPQINTWRQVPVEIICSFRHGNARQNVIARLFEACSWAGNLPRPPTSRIVGEYARPTASQHCNAALSRTNSVHSLETASFRNSLTLQLCWCTETPTSSWRRTSNECLIR